MDGLVLPGRRFKEQNPQVPSAGGDSIGNMLTLNEAARNIAGVDFPL
jgi:hypothetical protein